MNIIDTMYISEILEQEARDNAALQAELERRPTNAELDAELQFIDSYR